MQRYVISIDVGGTFTDCVIIGDDGRTAVAKARSTPADNFRSGRVRALLLGRDPAHQNDLGGSVPGSFCQTATDIWSDPTPLPPFKIVSRGRIDRQMEELYRRHSRMPVHLSLDLRSAIAANNQTSRTILRLVEKYGADTVKSSMRKIIDTGEEAFVEKLKRIPDGVWRERVFMERAITGDTGTYRVDSRWRSAARS